MISLMKAIGVWLLCLVPVAAWILWVLETARVYGQGGELVLAFLSPIVFGVSVWFLWVVTVVPIRALWEHFEDKRVEDGIIKRYAGRTTGHWVGKIMERAESDRRSNG